MHAGSLAASADLETCFRHHESHKGPRLHVLYSGAFTSGALLTLQGLPLSGLANPELVNNSQQTDLPEPTPHHLSLEPSHSGPLIPTPNHAGPGTRQLGTSFLLKLFKPSDPKPAYPASPVPSCRRHIPAPYPHPPQTWCFPVPYTHTAVQGSLHLGTLPAVADFSYG